MKNYEIVEESVEDLPNYAAKDTVLKRLLDKFKRKPKAVQPTLTPMIKEKSIWDEAVVQPTMPPKKAKINFVNIIVGLLALMCGMYGVMILYNQLPSNPTLVLGIVAVAASTGIITNTSRG
jgi:hypothetical protein